MMTGDIAVASDNDIIELDPESVRGTYAERLERLNDRVSDARIAFETDPAFWDAHPDIRQHLYRNPPPHLARLAHVTVVLLAEYLRLEGWGASRRQVRYWDALLNEARRTLEDEYDVWGDALDYVKDAMRVER